MVEQLKMTTLSLSNPPSYPTPLPLPTIPFLTYLSCCHVEGGGCARLWDDAGLWRALDCPFCPTRLYSDEQTSTLPLMKVADPSTRCRSAFSPWRLDDLSSSRVKVGRPLGLSEPYIAHKVFVTSCTLVWVCWFTAIVAVDGFDPGLIQYALLLQWLCLNTPT